MTIKLDAEIYNEPMVTEWLVGRIDHDYITIQRKRQEDGSWRFAVYNGSRYCLSREGEWCYESFPSSRPDDWYETHRFETFAEAAVAAKPAAEAILKEWERRVASMNAKAAKRDAAS